MACTRGCCETPAEHYRSLAVANISARNAGKLTVDDHGTHTVEVKESWGDRQDVTVKPRAFRRKMTTVED